MKKYALLIVSSWFAGQIGLPIAAAAKEVVESARRLPVVQEVDVVVVGGTSAGVAAAVEAARQGAKVFLAAPRPYLGEDICGTYRLWLEPGEKPSTDLAKAVFALPSGASAPRAGLPFKYTASLPADRQHPDSIPPSRLADGKYHGAPTQSVQYNGSVTLTLDLGQAEDVRRINVMVYQRNRDFEVARVRVQASADAQQWRPVGELNNERLGEGGFERTALILAADIHTQARYLKLEVVKGPEASRVLLGEVVVEGPAEAAVTAPALEVPRAVKPMQVKRVLDQALLHANVPFLYYSPATDLLTDANGYPAGVVIANRSGRQAVIAKVIIDATESGLMARLANVVVKGSSSRTRTFQRVVVGGPPRAHSHLTLRRRSTPFMIYDRAEQPHAVLEYQLELPWTGPGFGAQAEAEQMARDWTWSPEAVDASEVLFAVPTESIQGKQNVTGPWPGAERIALEAFRPAAVDQLFVLGGCADISREAAAQLLRPVNAMAVGARIGRRAAQVARALPTPNGVRLAGHRVRTAVPGEVGEVSPQVNPRAGAESIPVAPHGVPVLGEYDVVVVGGGTGGAPAGIAAGRAGAKTLLIEYLYGLGGVGTMGLISSYYHGNRVGFTHEVDEGVLAFGGKNPRVSSASWNPEHKIEWYRRALRQAGVDIWYGTLGAGAVVENGRVKGVVVVTPQGRGVVLAKVVIDSTGNADIAAAAGAPCRYIDETHVAVQGTGLPPKELGARYTNTDYTFVDDTDVFDVWRALVTAKEKFKGAYDLGQLVDTRERRQIIGDFTLSPMDMMLGRTFPDTIVISRSNFDTHGFIVHPLFMLRPPDRKDVDVRVPYRCLLPRGLDGILVTGLGISAHRDALPVIRMQADVQNQGYAAGVAAAMVAQNGGTTRQLDLKALQRHLVDKGNLPESVLSETDSFPLPRGQIVAAVARLTNNYDGLAIVLAQFELAQPLLRAAYRTASHPEARLIYAHVLGMMHDATGVGTLVHAVAETAWDKGWRYKGMGQFGPSMSPLDSLIIALGRTGAEQALPPILAKVEQLDPDSAFSHFRAVAIALESLGQPAAARPLAALLRKPGMGGHALEHIDTALEITPASRTDTSLRNRALSELVLARALYRCGDDQGLGRRTLRQYARDLHGLYARHAQAVLQEKPGR